MAVELGIFSLEGDHLPPGNYDVPGRGGRLEEDIVWGVFWRNHVMNGCCV